MPTDCSDTSKEKAAAFLSGAGVHITLSRFRVKRLLPFLRDVWSELPLTRRPVPLFRVSGGAYRELFLPDKRKFKIIF